MRLISLQPECYYKSDKEPNYSIPLHPFGNAKFYHTHIVTFCKEMSTSETPSDSIIHRITADRTDLCHANDKALIYASGGWFLKGKQAHNDASIPLMSASFLCLPAYVVFWMLVYWSSNRASELGRKVLAGLPV